MVMVSEHLKVCPICGGDEFVKDYKREELYCNSCGLVLQSAVQYCGLEKIDNIVPYSAPSSARNGIHFTYKSRQDYGKSSVSQNTTNYRHSIPNKYLMRFRKGRQGGGYQVYGR